MIIAFLLAVHAPQPAGFTPAEERAVLATMECQKRYLDAVPRRERRRRSQALIEEALGACPAEEAALRAALRTRFNAEAAEQMMQLIRNTTRDGMADYVRR